MMTNPMAATEAPLGAKAQTRLAKLHARGLPPPTPLELRLFRALERLDLRYVIEAPFGGYRVDAWLPVWAIGLEADGCHFHCCARCGWDDGGAEALRRARRDTVLLERHGVLIVHLAGHDCRTDEETYHTLVTALRPYCHDMVFPEAEDREA